MGESGSCRNNRIQLGGGRGEGGVEGAGRLRGMGDTILSGETGRGALEIRSLTIE